jgi:uncharacterized protein (UPF0333 family)
MPNLKSQRGQGLVEYVLLLVLMVVLAAGAVHYVGQKTQNAFSQAGKTLDQQLSYAQNNGANPTAAPAQ